MKNLMKILVFVVIISSCKERNPNNNYKTVVEIQSFDGNEITLDSTYLKTKVYVPIYSQIYEHTLLEKTMITATLSIRNTSEKDSLFVKRVDYFNTRGNLVRKYLKNSIFLKPLETIEYVIEDRDTLGGSGANFLVEYKARKRSNPLIQSVMVGGKANRSFAFVAEAIPVDEE